MQQEQRLGGILGIHAVNLIENVVPVIGLHLNGLPLAVHKAAERNLLPYKESLVVTLLVYRFKVDWVALNVARKDILGGVEQHNPVGVRYLRMRLLLVHVHYNTARGYRLGHLIGKVKLQVQIITVQILLG